MVNIFNQSKCLKKYCGVKLTQKIFLGSGPKASSSLDLDPDPSDGKERWRERIGDHLVDRLFARQQPVVVHHPGDRGLHLQQQAAMFASMLRIMLMYITSIGTSCY